jgi:8-oxo-dGTP pyrophosphatase MutT (NUDIX family)
MEQLKKELTSQIAKGLPGKDTQLKLAPESRDLFTPVGEKTDAAILILIYPNSRNKLHTVLMKRQSYHGHHSGQVSFPGGKHEKSDKNLLHTALRESQEEIGIIPGRIEIIGELTNLFIPVSNFMVHPFLGLTSTIPEFKPDRSEVDYLIEVSLQQIAAARIEVTSMKFKGHNYNVPYYNLNNEMVWGATAMIMSEFIEIINPVTYSLDQE